MATVEHAPDGSFVIDPGPGRRVTWGLFRISNEINVTTYPRGDSRMTVRFPAAPYTWFGTCDDFGEDKRTPRQFRLYADGRLVEGPPGNYDPHIVFPKWDDEP